MLRIEKIKEKIKNFDTDVTADELLSCWLHRITTNSSVNKHNCSGLVCSECLRRSLLDLLEEYKEEYKKPVKLTKFEYEYLKVAKKEGFNFIARDKSNRLYGFEKQPTKGNATWGSRGDYVGMFKSIFSFAKWEDEEPYSINSILSNCEVIEDEKS
ncbi:hypothetical protein [Thomasclavelia ramosa]|jgi:hypothetical protein|uniref:hypothetical protein n=1 Tax=Thomasclavelia ramosa TaxID=1547 RepID=UPI000E470D66|nr:hypothetical protein [Thomasclavelia ramosa]RGQ34042.1 hypothetical protein DWY98_17250 [Thomasclavelia ramosa]RGQ51179.1 hypothetical protein DWY94_08530 [Thomasclavelia ramosa]